MSSLTKTIVLVVVLLCITQLAICAVTTGYPKRCAEFRKINETFPVMVVGPVRVLEYEWCLSSISFRCTKYVTKVQAVIRHDTIEKMVEVSVCCPGYGESSDGETCFRLCECPNGMCDLSGECSQPCDRNHYGMNCSETCKCQNGGTCHHISGECNCTGGWTGRFCEEACPKVEGTRDFATSFEIKSPKSTTELSSNSNQEIFVLFDVKINSDKMAELSKRFGRGDWIFSVSARRVKTAEEPASQMDSGSLEEY